MRFSARKSPFDRGRTRQKASKWIEISDKFEVLLKDVVIDPEERKLIWPDAIRLDLDQSIRRINKQHPCFSEYTIKEFLIFWASSAVCYVGRLLKVEDGQT
jgi:hypothetical protein